LLVRRLSLLKGMAQRCAKTADRSGMSPAIRRRAWTDAIEYGERALADIAAVAGARGEAPTVDGEELARDLRTLIQRARAELGDGASGG
jgi:hypothetical protein